MVMRFKTRLLSVSLAALSGCGGMDSADSDWSGTAPPNQGPVPVAPADAAREPDAPLDPSSVTSNPFVVAEFDPFSTFAADVDTASYDIFRRSLELGSLPSAL